MEQLLKITTIPIEFQLKINNARLEYSQSTADLEISRDEGGLRIRSQRIRLNLDTFEARNSVCPTTMRSVQQYAEKGRNAAYEATATFAREGQLLLNAKLGDDALDQIISSRMDNMHEYGLSFTPATGPEITWSEPDLTIQYQMDKLNFEWKISNGNFEFIPGNIEVSIAQQPDIIIEYIGSPIYVPPSADPNNTATIDVRA
ncbi:MAG: hypothetical protein GX299_02305 [Epulopiscium sp.]|nr:hypothetical protein [Candidatus Epulonipiscium sp.]